MYGYSASSNIVTQYSKTGRKDADPETNIENGTCYLLTAPVQPTVISTYKVLSSRFDKFYDFMSGFEAYADVLTFAGISNVVNEKSKKSEQTAYMMFEVTNAGNTEAQHDERMRMLSAYNYTLYAPTNDAMDAAYAAGLPTWDDVNAIYEQWADMADTDAAG